MINQGNDVPEKTIALFIDEWVEGFTRERLNNIIEKSNFKRDWFVPHFYKCLPLSIANQQGYSIKSEYGFYATWNGENNFDGLKIEIEGKKEEIDKLYPAIKNHFGYGIVTINMPFVMRTPPGVNLLVTAPLNQLMPGVTVMSGVVETDNLRNHFTFNLKLNIPHAKVYFPPNTPLATIIPIQRYFADDYELKFGEDIFEEKVYLEELQADMDFTNQRTEIDYLTTPHGQNKFYKKGVDVYGNKFPDHQLPNRKSK
jgi:hypothetical protein